MPKAHDGFICSRWPLFGNCPRRTVWLKSKGQGLNLSTMISLDPSHPFFKGSETRTAMPTSGYDCNRHWKSCVGTLQSAWCFADVQYVFMPFYLFFFSGLPSGAISGWACCVECFNVKTLCNSVAYSNGKPFKTLVGNSTLHPTCAQHPSHSWWVVPPRSSASSQRVRGDTASRRVNQWGRNCRLSAAIQDLLAKLWKRETRYRAGTSEWGFLCMLLLKQ